MVLLVWMALKGRREKRVILVKWVPRDCQVLLDDRAKLVKMEQQVLLEPRVKLDHQVHLDFLVRLVQEEILENLVPQGPEDLKEDREDEASKGS